VLVREQRLVGTVSTQRSGGEQTDGEGDQDRDECFSF
jgi:hypothetical protein